MAHEADELDGRLAERLARAADGDPACAPSLDAAAQARVLAALLRESARHKRERRNQRWAAGALVAVAACVAVAWVLRPARDALPVADAVVSVDQACGLPTQSTGVHIVAEAARQHLALGRYGQLAAEPGAALRIVSSTPCELTVALTRGMVAADLHDLRPARLRVLTALGDVEVRGTRFSVRVDEAERWLEVVLLHGAVDVVKDEQVARLTPGQTLRRASRATAPHMEANTRSAALAIETLISGSPAEAAAHAPDATSPATPPPAVERTASDAAVSDAANKSSPVRSATELLASAERERRAGRLDAARALYREAGTRRGADAEVALLRWARLELSSQAAADARDVLARYRKHFTGGRLAAEAAWLELRALEELGDVAAARAIARQLIEAYPDSPHAHAAARLLSAP